jgi:CHAT domain-containing protein
MRRVPLVLVLALALNGAARAADDDAESAALVKSILAASQGFLDAFRANDGATMDRLAQARTPDPVRVEASLLGSHVRAATSEPPGGDEYLRAAAEFARRSEGNRAAVGVREIHAAFAEMDRAALDREVRLRTASEQLAEAGAKSDFPRVIEIVREREADLDAQPASVRPVFLQQDHGIALWRLGRHVEALVPLERARRQAAAMPWPGGVLRSLRFEYSILRELGDVERALALGLEAVRLNHELGHLAAAALVAVECVAHMRLAAQHTAALALADQARGWAAEAGSAPLEAEARLARGKVLLHLGRDAEASALAAEVVALGAPRVGPDVVVSARLLQSSIASQHDRYGEALGLLDAALADLGESPAPRLRSNLWGTKAIVLRRLRKLEESREAHRRAAQLAQEARDAVLLGVALGNLGLVEWELGEPSYQRTLEQALEVKRRSGDRLGALETLLNLGRNMSRDEATRQRGLAHLAEAAEGLRALGYPLQHAVALSAMANAHSRSTDAAAAEPLSAEAVRLLRSIGERGSQAAHAYEVRAAVLLQLGRPDEALDFALEALSFRRGLASGLGDEEAEGVVGLTRSSGGLALRSALAVAARDPAAADRAAAGAFEALESTRATLLAASVRNAHALAQARVPAQLVAREAARRAAVKTAQARLVEAAYRAKSDPSLVHATRDGLDRAFREHALVVAELQRVARGFAGVVFPQPVTLADLQRRLADEGAYVAYHVSDDASSALVVTKRRARLVPLGDPASLRTAIDAFRALVAAPGSDDVAVAASLHERLLRPLDADLAGTTSLLVSPDGALAFLPFEALVVSTAPRRRLIELSEVTYVPSATLLDSLHVESGTRAAGARGGFLGLGDPAYAPVGGGGPALAPLPWSAAEVRAAASHYPEAHRTLLLGKDATAAKLLAALEATPDRLDALHFACHAFVDPERPRLSSLALAGGDVLDLDAIYRLRIPADLAVLSACSTAQGRYVEGEGVMGFVRGFFYAGVPRVIVSNWVVQDREARGLMESFHAALVRPGRGAAQALREAKLAALASKGPAAHPSAWAAFVLWGLPE